MRNLTTQEARKVIFNFNNSLKGLVINNKAFALGADEEYIHLNPEITIEEIRQTFGIKEENKLDFVRQLYLRTISNRIKTEIEDSIANPPTISFTMSGENIQLNY